MNSQHPSSGEGSGKRKRGRPALGKPEQVRLSVQEKALALDLGNGILAQGVRVALARAALLDGPAPTGQKDEIDSRDARKIMSALRILNSSKSGAEPTADEIAQQIVELMQVTSSALQKRNFKKVTLSSEDLAVAQEMGQGSIEEGVHVALQAAKFLGVETSRKFKKHGTGT